MSFLSDMDDDILDVFCDAESGWGTACVVNGHDGKSFTCVCSIAEAAKQIRDSGQLMAEGREVESLICSLQNGDPDGELLSDAWGRSLQMDDSLTIACGPDSGIWTVVWAQPTSAKNYRAMLRLESLRTTKMREGR